MPEQAAPIDHDRVHGADCTRFLGQLVEQGNDRLLARIGDVEAREPHATRRLDQAG
jgi:hypothetical protein